MKSRIITFCLTLFLTAGLFVTPGCDSLFDDKSNGTLRILLTDAPFPFDLVREANVTIPRVDLVTQGDGIITLSDSSMSFNLLELRDGVTAFLAEQELPAGIYNQLRLIVSDASIVLNDDTVFDLFVPSGAQTGLKIQMDNFAVVAGEETVITLDFDVEQSFIVQGNPATPAGIQGFIMKPVIKPIRVEQPAGE